MEIKTVSMKEYSSLRIGGEGVVAEVTDEGDLKDALTYAKNRNLQAYVLGQGTNTYFGENLEGFLFIKINTKGISYEQNAESRRITASSGEIWDDLVGDAVSKGLRGLENLSYIPGTVGAAPVQNIGAYGMELKDVFISCRVFDVESGEVVVLTKEGCLFGYRDSIFKHKKGRYIILTITLEVSHDRPFNLSYKPLDELSSQEELNVEQVRNTVIKVRKQKLPEWKEHPNCGSFFKNPMISKNKKDEVQKVCPDLPAILVGEEFKVPAAWLIEHVGEFKGERVGDVGTWPNQSLVVVNYGDAIADDVDSFASIIKKRIFEKTGVILEQEVNRVG